MLHTLALEYPQKALNPNLYVLCSFLGLRLRLWDFARVEAWADCLRHLGSEGLGFRVDRFRKPLKALQSSALEMNLLEIELLCSFMNHVQPVVLSSVVSADVRDSGLWTSAY